MAVIGIAILMPADAGSAKKNRVPSLLTYKAMVHIAGGVSFISHRDTLRNCEPGQQWTMKEDADVDIRGNVLVETYRNRQVRSSSAVEPGGARNQSQLTSYAESNYCPPDEPVEIDQPQCESNTGKGVVALLPDPRRAGPKRVSIGVSRKGGGEQDLSCIWGLSSRATPIGARVSPLESVFSSIVLPLDIRIAQLRSLGVKKRLIRTIRVGGTCEAPVIYRGQKIPTDTSDMDDGDCVVDGDFVVTVKRLNRISRKGVPVG